MSTIAAEPEPYQIQCAEIWGGVLAKEDDVATPGVRAAIHSSASGDAKGGDLYYFSVCAYDTLTRIAVADVRGHGEAVSHLSAWLYQALEARMNDSDSARVLTDLNEIVRKQGFEAITTAVVATVNRDKGEMSYSYAGHPPMMLGKQGRDWKPLEADSGAKGPANLPLGIMPGVSFTQEKVRVDPGDRLFLFSDGVVECPGPEADQFYGDGRMHTVLGQTAGETVAMARERVRGDLTEYAGGSLMHDDCTFLMVEILKPPPFWKRRIFAGGKRRRST